MKIDQELFYSSIAKYYNQVFPLNESQISFVRSMIQSLPEKQILDIGCSTGQLSRSLAGFGSQVTGIDLNPDMIHIAQSEPQLPNLKFIQANMLDLDVHFSETTFDAVVCFGNTLVHLDSTDEVATFLKQVTKVLKPGGKLLIQILNYDLILDQGIEELPLIDGPKVSFIRKYDLPNRENEKIIFNAELVIKSSRESLFHASRLLALRKNDLQELLDHYGFGRTKFYANFDEKPYRGNHLPLVLSTERPA